MDTFHKMELWADRHHPVWIDYLRMLFGLYLFFKGYMFIANTDALAAMMSGSSIDRAFNTMAVAHYIAFAHLVGGLLVAFGLITRVAIAFQLPILVGAIVFVNLAKGFYSFAIWESILVLLLLLIFFVFGSGKFSLDTYVKRHQNRW